MRVTKNFTMREFTRSSKADELGIENKPSSDHTSNLVDLIFYMQGVRDHLGAPVIITSGYRNPEVNRAVGGVPTSAHALGWACDFVCPAYGSVLDTCREIESAGFVFDQLIYEVGARSQWIHLSIDPRGRQEVLTYRYGQGYSRGLP